MWKRNKELPIMLYGPINFCHCITNNINLLFLQLKSILQGGIFFVFVFIYWSLVDRTGQYLKIYLTLAKPDFLLANWEFASVFVEGWNGYCAKALSAINWLNIFQSGSIVIGGLTMKCTYHIMPKTTFITTWSTTEKKSITTLALGPNEPRIVPNIRQNKIMPKVLVPSL